MYINNKNIRKIKKKQTFLLKKTIPIKPGKLLSLYGFASYECVRICLFHFIDAQIQFNNKSNCLIYLNKLNIKFDVLFLFFHRSTTLSFVWQYSTPTKWHFAAHMGQLMRDTIDSFGRATGCSELWPQCPFNSATLLQLNKKDAGSLSGY